MGTLARPFPMNREWGRARVPILRVFKQGLTLFAEQVHIACAAESALASIVEAVAGRSTFREG